MNPSTTRFKILLAFLTLYVVWGSTYLAIRIGVGTLPPLLFTAPRWLIAGGVLLIYARWRGQALPTTLREWRIVTITGLLLIVGGNGLVVIAEQWVSSSLAALIVASAALWIAGLGMLGPQGEPISVRGRWGLIFGFIGVAILLWPRMEDFSMRRIAGELTVAVASVLWALGTIYARRARPATGTIMSTALQALIGGATLGVLGLLHGESAHWQWYWPSLGALAYLTIFGTLGFVTYLWLMHETTPAKLGTYAYVNPAIAVLLGWGLLDERLSAHQLLGMIVVLLAVIAVTTAKAVRKIATTTV